MWNCPHFAFPIILGVSEPANSPELLENYRRSSRERIAIDGVTKTRYEWARQQRKLETAVRRQKDIATGDGVLRREAQYKIERYQAAYDRITDRAMLTADKSRKRMSGVRSVKTFDEKAVFASKELLDIHLEKHLKEYGDVSEDEYINRARELLQNEPSDDILVFKRTNGDALKYRISTNESVVGTRERKIQTTFRPKRGRKHWDNVIRKKGWSKT